MHAEVTGKKLVGALLLCGIFLFTIAHQNLPMKILTKFTLIYCITSVLKKLIFVVN